MSINWNGRVGHLGFEGLRSDSKNEKQTKMYRASSYSR